MANRFLGVNLSKLVAKNLKGKLRPATLIKKTAGTRTPAALAAGTNPTGASFVAEGFVETYKDHQIDGTLIKRNDRKISLVGDLIVGGGVPEPGDHITIEGATYRIEREGVGRDPAKALYECHTRAV